MTTTAIEAAVAAYADLGWSVFPIPEGEKKTTELGWPDAPDDPWRVVREQPANVAVRLGERSSYLADVDLDDDAARAVAPLLLPATGCQLGRDNVTGITHRLYVCPDGPPRGQPGTTKKGPVELRWTGAYTVVPPSRHPEGGRYRWQPGDFMPVLAPPAVAWGTLHRSVTEVAAAALLLRCYPEWARAGERHLATLALAGALLGEGWDLPRVERFVFALATAGADEEAADRVDNARSQWDALQRGAPMTGWRSLAGYAGSARVDLVRRYLGFLDAGGGSAWSAIMGQSSRTNGVGGTPPQQPPQATQTPNVGRNPSAGVPAPVIATAQQAAQQASAQANKAQANYSPQKVALDVAVAIQNAYPLARDEGLVLYRYVDGVYTADNVEMVLRRAVEAEVLASFGEDYLSRRMEDEVIHRLTVGAEPLEERPARGWLNLANGRLNIATGDLEPHHYRHRTTMKLPIVYDPAARCPHIERFFAQVFPVDAVEAGVPFQVVAMCCAPLRGIDKAILLLGPGENGKGVYLDIVQAFVGTANASHVSLQRMGDNTFATAELRGKVLNVCSDLPTKRVDDSGDFKAIVSGEAIRAERKHKPAFDFVPFCRLLFSANNLPESVDVSTGYFRRWYMIPFAVNFAPGNPQRREREELLAELLAPEELSGLLNAVLPYLRRFLEERFRPTVTDSMKELIEEFVAFSDPFPAWVQQALQASPQGWVETATIAQRYQERMARQRRDQLPTPQAVGDAVKEAFPQAVRSQRRTGGSGSGTQVSASGKRKWGWSGVSWRLGSMP